MFDEELASFWSSLQQAEHRIEAEATETERQLYRTIYGYKSRVMRLRAALAASGPLARQAVATKLEGIKLDAIWDILYSAVRDMALYYGGSVVLGTAIGAGLGSLAGGVGAIPGAAIGAEAGNLLGEWVLMFLGLKMLAEGLVNTIPAALRLYVQGFRIAWGPVDSDRPDARYSADYYHGEDMAAHRFADGHVLMIMAILIAIVAYLLRGKSEEALMQAVRKSERLGTKMADWLAENKERLLKEESLKPKVAERAPSQEAEPGSLSNKRGAPSNSAGAQSPTKASATPRPVSDRLKYMGRTPSKYSRTGTEVVERMKTEGLIQGEGPLLPGNPNNLRVLGPDGDWYNIDQTIDMAHTTDAVTWWNDTGRFYGPKSPEVRQFMLDSNNYRLEPQSFNRSAGASLGQTYLPPASPSFDTLE